MSEITRWVFTVCCGAMLCGVVSILTPGKGSERLMGTVLGLFMLCCFLIPAGISLDLALDGPDLADASSAMGSAAEEMTRYFLEDTQNELRRRLEQELAEAGINGEDFQIYIEAEAPGEERGLGLSATVTLPSGLRDRENELKERLEQALGVAVAIRCREEKNREGL